MEEVTNFCIVPQVTEARRGGGGGGGGGGGECMCSSHMQLSLTYTNM